MRPGSCTTLAWQPKTLRMIGKSIEIHTKPRSLKRQHHFPRIPNNFEVLAASIAAMQIPTAGIAGDRAVSCVACVTIFLKILVVEGLCEPKLLGTSHGFLPQQIGPLGLGIRDTTKVKS